MDAPTSVEPSAASDVVYCIAPSTRTCFAACLSGLRRSDDLGARWQMAAPPPGEIVWPAAFAVAASPAFARDGRVFTGVSGGVLRSYDGGTTWHGASLGSPPPLVSAIAVSPAFESDGVVFAGTAEDGIFRSDDRGERWSSWNFGLLDLAVLAIATSASFAEDGTMFVGTETGLFRSTNSGRAWRETALPDAAAPVLSLAICPDGALLAGTEHGGLLRSGDLGVRWLRLAEDELVQPINAIATSPDGAIAVVHGADALLSRDNGRTWRGGFGLELGQRASCVTFLGESGGLVGLIGGGVLRW
jgi:photosystem II stability/assembly factor-like uncharacterized protein